jgi:tellurite resistance protein
MEHQRVALRDREQEVTTLRQAAEHIGVAGLRDGSWFRRVVAAHVKKRAAANDGEHWDRLYPGLSTEERAKAQILRVARMASAAGALGSLGAGAGELLALFTEGLAAPVGVPAAVVSMALEGAYTSLLQVDLACDIASMYGVPFDADDVGEVATLFGLAFEVDVKRKKGEGEAGEGEKEPDIDGGLTARLLELEDSAIATKIGKKLLEDAFVRNIIPVAGVFISARWNYVGTKRLGAAVNKYVRYRRALLHACSKLRLDQVAEPKILVAGAWLLATTDGDAGHEEVMTLALIMDMLSEEQRRTLELDKTLGDDEEGWFEMLKDTPKAMHAPLLDVLYLVAASDRELAAAERRFLRRVGKALGQEADLDRVRRISRHLSDGETLPPGMYLTEN